MGRYKDICQNKMKQKKYSNESDNNRNGSTSTEDVEPILFLSQLNWAFVFLQQNQQRMIEDGNIETLQQLWKMEVLDQISFPKEKFQEKILKEDINKLQPLLDSTVESIEFIHHELCSILPSSHGQTLLDVFYMQQKNIATQLFRTLCDVINVDVR